MERDTGDREPPADKASTSPKEDGDDSSSRRIDQIDKLEPQGETETKIDALEFQYLDLSHQTIQELVDTDGNSFDLDRIHPADSGDTNSLQSPVTETKVDNPTANLKEGLATEEASVSSRSEALGLLNSDELSLDTSIFSLPQKFQDHQPKLFQGLSDGQPKRLVLKGVQQQKLRPGQIPILPRGSESVTSPPAPSYMPLPREKKTRGEYKKDKETWTQTETGSLGHKQRQSVSVWATPSRNTSHPIKRSRDKYILAKEYSFTADQSMVRYASSVIL